MNATLQIQSSMFRLGCASTLEEDVHAYVWLSHLPARLV